MELKPNNIQWVTSSTVVNLTPSPQLTLSAKWLSELGFTVGSNVTLTRQAGQLIIRLAGGGSEF